MNHPSHTIPTVTLAREFDAAPDRVFAAWTEPDALRRWFHPDPAVETYLAQVDLTVGGRYRIGMRNRQGDTFIVGGEYLEVEPPHRLVFTWAWEAGADPAHSQVTVTIEPLDGGRSRVTLDHARLETEADRTGHGEGWNGTLAQLAAYLDG